MKKRQVEKGKNQAHKKMKKTKRTNRMVGKKPGTQKTGGKKGRLRRETHRAHKNAKKPIQRWKKGEKTKTERNGARIKKRSRTKKNRALCWCAERSRKIKSRAIGLTYKTHGQKHLNFYNR